MLCSNIVQTKLLGKFQISTTEKQRMLRLFFIVITLAVIEEHLQLFCASAAQLLNRMCLLSKRQVFTPAVQGSPAHLQTLQTMTKVCSLQTEEKKKRKKENPTSENSPRSDSGLSKICLSRPVQGSTSSSNDEMTKTRHKPFVLQCSPSFKFLFH